MDTAQPIRPARELRLLWPFGIVILGVATALVALWALQNGQRSEYYAAAALSMSQSWHNFFFGALDPSATVSIDKIPGSFWFPALFVRLFGFSTWSVNAPNALALVAATLIAAFTARRIVGTYGGLLTGVLVAATPIFMAVAKSNQPESFFVLTIAATAWAGVKAVNKASLKWLLLAGIFVALGFQTYMLEAWAVWPALGIAYLITAGKPLRRKIIDVLIAGATSAIASLLWIFTVWLVPASSRPYVGGTYTNSPWELVFGYNGLGRFSATQNLGDYESFTPPFSGNPSLWRLFNSQVGAQVAWLIPAALVAIVALVLMRTRPALVVFLGGWFVTLCVMFSVVAGMHQFYTAALAVPMALLIGLAFARAWQVRLLWPQLALLVASAATACVFAWRTPSYLPWAAPVQLVFAAIAAVLLVARQQGWRPAQGAWVLIPALIGLAFTPAAWSVDTINHPNSMNPVAGDGTAVGIGGTGPGGAIPGGRMGSPPGGFGGDAPQGGPGMPGGVSNDLLNYVIENRDGAQYLFATFGAQTAAS